MIIKYKCTALKIFYWNYQQKHNKLVKESKKIIRKFP